MNKTPDTAQRPAQPVVATGPLFGGLDDGDLKDRYFCPSCHHDFAACDSVFALPTGPAQECPEDTPGRATACPRCFYTFPEYY